MGTLHFQLKVSLLLRWIAMKNVSFSYECSVYDALDYVLYGVSDIV